MAKKTDYYRVRRFDESENLKKYDAYERKGMIGFAEDCVRGIKESTNHVCLTPAPRFGTVHTSLPLQDAVKDAIAMYQRVLAVNLLYYVYGENELPEDVMDVTPEMAEEILRRFYPSNTYWLHNEEGRPDSNDGLTKPKKQLRNLDEYLSPDPEVRKRIFNIDTEKRRYAPLPNRK